MISIAQIRDHVRGGAPEAALLKVFVNLVNKERFLRNLENILLAFYIAFSWSVPILHSHKIQVSFSCLSSKFIVPKSKFEFEKKYMKNFK